MINVSCIKSGNYETNCYLVYNNITRLAIIIDPGTDFKKIISETESLLLKPVLLINTHGHADHITGDDEIRTKYNIPLAIHKDDLYMLSDSEKNLSLFISDTAVKINKPEVIFDKDNEEYNCELCKYKIIHTPGHTKGSVCILIENMLFCGDTLFAGSAGRTDLEGGSSLQLNQSLKKFKSFNPDTVIFPGHGPQSVLKEEFANNIFLR